MVVGRASLPANDRQWEPGATAAERCLPGREATSAVMGNTGRAEPSRPTRPLMRSAVRSLGGTDKPSLSVAPGFLTADTAVAHGSPVTAHFTPCIVRDRCDPIGSTCDSATGLGAARL